MYCAENSQQVLRDSLVKISDLSVSWKSEKFALDMQAVLSIFVLTIIA